MLPIEASSTLGLSTSRFVPSQSFSEPSILQNMVPGNAITTYYTPNMYAYNLSFAGNQSNYAAALAITMAVITMAIAYAVQLNSMKEQMK